MRHVGERHVIAITPLNPLLAYWCVWNVIAWPGFLFSVAHEPHFKPPHADTDLIFSDPAASIEITCFIIRKVFTSHLLPFKIAVNWLLKASDIKVYFKPTKTVFMTPDGDFVALIIARPKWPTTFWLPTEEGQCCGLNNVENFTVSLHR